MAESSYPQELAARIEKRAAKKRRQDATAVAFLAVRVDGTKAQGRRIVLNWRFTDTGENYVLHLENGALGHVPDAQAPDADATLSLERATLDAISLQQTTVAAAMQSGAVQVQGDPQKVAALFGMLDSFRVVFPVVEPRRMP